ncbi:class I SAM-dependent methyltransferase [Desulfosporosinus youngiae]|uniref:Methylase involved in ubiquinone/menaquinone biosynthesis n=1 Tax=Desulfosporosinus youngiae DSM 17734 TaxID=768710 RepID=H5Y473_9FIRM|nr:methyltransferase domain-containing protein [Desulfosporosinus youngiae]EHQ89754.1 methylase involved in ubiquinone/menaquinone biosynthesis [Desulfosporosinus youngiae DSM 17734]
MIGENKRVEEMNYFELIAWLGIGSSHPGGFPATKQNLDAVQIKPEEYVLDAGCGSGLTACHLAKTVGCKIMGIDINSQMIEKARQRAEKEGVSHLVEFKVADVYELPFADNQFDVVIAESIAVFLDKVKVYRELYRVLKPEGRVADLEMAILKEMPAAVRHQMEECFGSGTNPLPFQEWLEALAQAGFQDVDIKNPQPLRDNGNIVLNELKKDWVLVKDLMSKINRQPGLVRRLQKNAGFMKRNRSYFGFGLVYGRKPTPPPLKLGFKDRLWQVLFRRKPRQ